MVFLVVLPIKVVWNIPQYHLSVIHHIGCPTFAITRPGTDSPDVQPLGFHIHHQVLVELTKTKSVLHEISLNGKIWILPRSQSVMQLAWHLSRWVGWQDSCTYCNNTHAVYNGSSEAVFNTTCSVYGWMKLWFLETLVASCSFSDLCMGICPATRKSRDINEDNSRIL